MYMITYTVLLEIQWNLHVIFFIQIYSYLWFRLIGIDSKLNTAEKMTSLKLFFYKFTSER